MARRIKPESKVGQVLYLIHNVIGEFTTGTQVEVLSSIVERGSERRYRVRIAGIDGGPLDQIWVSESDLSVADPLAGMRGYGATGYGATSRRARVPKIRFRVYGTDDHFKYRDRMADASSGHMISAEVPTLGEAQAILTDWMDTHPPQGRGARASIEEAWRDGSHWAKAQFVASPDERQWIDERALYCER